MAQYVLNRVFSGDDKFANVKNSDAIRASHYLPHNDRSIAVTRGSRSDEYVIS